MKGFRFYAELDDRRASKSGSKRFCPFTRALLKEWAAQGHKCNVVALMLGKEHQCHDFTQEAISATFSHEDSDTSLGSVAWEYLQKRCVRIDEATARLLHPRLFAKLDSE